MILTADKKCPIHCPKGGGYMGGHYRFDDKAGRFYVCVYWQKKKIFAFFRYLDEPIWHEKTASKLLNKIRAEIDDGTFDIRAYLPGIPPHIKSIFRNMAEGIVSLCKYKAGASVSNQKSYRGVG